MPPWLRLSRLENACPVLRKSVYFIWETMLQEVTHSERRKEIEYVKEETMGGTYSTAKNGYCLSGRSAGYVDAGRSPGYPPKAAA